MLTVTWHLRATLETALTAVLQLSWLLPLQLGDFSAALVDYEAALALDPRSSYAHYNCGIVRDRLGEYAAAVACFSAAIALEPGNADFYHVGCRRLGSWRPRGCVRQPLREPRGMASQREARREAASW